MVTGLKKLSISISVGGKGNSSAVRNYTDEVGWLRYFLYVILFLFFVKMFFSVIRGNKVQVYP